MVISDRHFIGLGESKEGQAKGDFERQCDKDGWCLICRWKKHWSELDKLYFWWKYYFKSTSNSGVSG